VTTSAEILTRWRSMRRNSGPQVPAVLDGHLEPSAHARMIHP